MEGEEFLTKLKELCLKYDLMYGTYPENRHEGQALWEFANIEMNYTTEAEWDKLLNAMENNSCN